MGEDGRWAAGAIPQGTNNIGELMGLLRGITDHAHVEHLVIQADSKYAIDTYEKWMDGARARGWKSSTGAPTKNRDLIEQLIAARDGRRAAGLPDVTLEHVRGHQGHRLNGWADERAVRATQHAKTGSHRDWTTDAGHPMLDVTVDAPSVAADGARHRAKATAGRR